MPKHSFAPLEGRIESIQVESGSLKGNLLGDPHSRTVAVYLPPGYDASTQQYPLFVDLAAFTGSGLKRLSWQSFGESIPHRIERLIQQKDMGPVVVAFPDAFTSLGGNQYVNSAAMGNWEDFLGGDMLKALENNYRLKKTRDSRAIYGKSSGGYGALIAGMRHADIWGAIACHSGDIDFDILYRRDFPGVVANLAHYNGSIEQFLTKLEEQQNIPGGDFYTLMILAMAASYDADPSAYKGIRLPVSLDTCTIDETAWSRWLQSDPLHIIDDPAAQQQLKSLRAVYIDCGFKDQYFLQFGARAFVKKLKEYSVDFAYEEFDGTHSGIDHRLDHSLPLLYRALDT